MVGKKNQRETEVEQHLVRKKNQKIQKNQRETEVEQHLVSEVQKRGGICVKFLPDFARGFPDRIVLLPGGVLIWVETKRPVGGRLDGIQNVQHLLLRRLGQRVEVVWTKEEADQLMLEFDGGIAGK